MAERAENLEVDIRGVLFAAGGVLLLLFVVLALLALLFPQLIHSPAPVLRQFPAPSVTIDERAQRINLERAQLERLSGKGGTMPIARAMAVIAAKAAGAYGPVQAGPP